MSFLTALLGAAGGYGQGRQQRFQNQEDQQRLASDTAYNQAQIDEEKAQTAAETKKAQLDAAEQGYDYGTLKPLPLTGKYEKVPPNATPQQLAEIAQRNYVAAINQQDAQGIATWGPAAKQLPGGFSQITNAEYTAGPKTDLTEAQAGWWKQRHGEVMAALKAREAEAGAAQAGLMQRAYLSAKTRTDIAGRSDDEREAIAMQTALNLATYHNEDQAYRAAVDEANRSDAQNLAVWKEQNQSAARTGGQLSAPPTMAPIVIPQAGNSTPVTINIVDPRTGQVKTVTAPRLPPPPPPPRRVPIAQEIAEAHRAGITDRNVIASQLIQAGYSQAQVNAALFPGGGFGKP
jgi:hypothetical protein